MIIGEISIVPVHILDIGGIKMDQVDLRQYWDTHDFSAGGECPICKKCGESPISLGIWGDTHWREIHEGWKEPCQGNKQGNDLRQSITDDEAMAGIRSQHAGKSEWLLCELFVVYWDARSRRETPSEAYSTTNRVYLKSIAAWTEP